MRNRNGKYRHGQQTEINAVPGTEPGKRQGGQNEGIAANGRISNIGHEPPIAMKTIRAATAENGRPIAAESSYCPYCQVDELVGRAFAEGSVNMRGGS